MQMSNAMQFLIFGWLLAAQLPDSLALLGCCCQSFAYFAICHAHDLWPVGVGVVAAAVSCAIGFSFN